MNCAMKFVVGLLLLGSCVYMASGQDQDFPVLLVDEPEQPEAQDGAAAPDGDSTGRIGAVPTIVSAFNDVDEDAEPFIATHEWQELKPGQPIPAGLHVEINVQTGVRRAKLLDKPAGVKTISEKRAERLEKLAPLLQDLQQSEAVGDDAAAADLTMGALHANSTRILLWAERLEALQAKSGSRPGLEPMTALVLTIANASVGEEARLGALSSLEEYVEELDLARLFASIGGLQPVIALLANANVSSPIRARAALVLGTACQNNAHVQAAVVADGGLELLIAQLRGADAQDELRRTVYAIGAVLRGQRAAQMRAVEDNAFTVLAGLCVDAHGTPTALANRIATLGADLVIQAAMDAHAATPSDTASPLLDASDADLVGELAGTTPFGQALVQQGWCAAVSQLAGAASPPSLAVVQLVVALQKPCSERLNALGIPARFYGAQKQMDMEDERLPWLQRLPSDSF